MHRAPAAALPRLRTNRARYERAVEMVHRRSAAGDLEGVLRTATVAANFAWRAPIGLLHDPNLERLVIRSVREDGARPELDGSRSAGRVLHVLSEAYAIGGHTRLVWRWMAHDPRRSDVALTNQQSPLPEPLQSAVSQSGGQLHDLRAEHPTLLARARALRQLMARADVVVYHVHPYDAVALAAANLPGPRPPIVYENHANFSFWLGVGCTDVIGDFLDRGNEWSRDLRGIRPERLGLIPLPMEEITPPSEAGAEIRRIMRMRADEVLALCVASPAKTAPVWGTGFDVVLGQALAAHPRLKILLAGASPVGAWAPLAAQYPSRLILPGPVSDPYPLYAAADIYLDSYPVPAGTAILEAAMSGLPILALRDLTERNGQARLFHDSSPGLAGVRHIATTEDAYLSQLRKLIRDPRLRAERGTATREAVLAAHTGSGWATAMEALYEQARRVEAADVDEYPEAIEDLDFGAMLLPFAGRLNHTLELSESAAPLGDLRDAQLERDMFAVTHRDDGSPLSVRISPGWESRPAWTRRLLALAPRYPRLSISLPFAEGDDAEGTLSVEQITTLLALDGRTTTDCGDIRLDHAPPVADGLAISGELPLTEDALDRLESLLSTPCWQAPVEQVPQALAV